MKIFERVLVALLFCVCSVTFLVAQDYEFEDYDFSSSDKATAQPYFALSFGGTASFQFMDYDALNEHLGKLLVGSQIADVPDIDGQFMSYGFNFFTALSPLINNARLGISYQTGSREVEQNYAILGNVNLYRKVEVNQIGINFGYAWVPMKGFAIIPELGVNVGDMLVQQCVTNTSTTISSAYTFSHHYIAVTPQVNIEYAVTSFLMLRLNGSYSFYMNNPVYENTWTYNGNNKYEAMPDKVKPAGFSASVGVFIGLFNY